MEFAGLTLGVNKIFYDVDTALMEYSAYLSWRYTPGSAVKELSTKMLLQLEKLGLDKK